jgi:hypothetical protein
MIGLFGIVIVASITPMNLSDGSIGFLIRCDGAGQTSDTCRMLAGRQCGHFGYRRINAETEKTRESRSNALAISGHVGIGSAASNTLIARSVIIKCGKDTLAENGWNSYQQKLVESNRMELIAAQQNKQQSKSSDEKINRTLIVVMITAFVGIFVLSIMP